MPSHVISLKNVTKIFKKRKLFGKKFLFTALDDITLEVPRGERLSIIGESGSGKTTLARIAAGLEEPTLGKVFWLGKDLSEISKEEFRKLRPKVQYIHQNPYTSLNHSRTIFSILADPLRKHKNPENLKEEVSRLLKMVGLVPPEYFFNKYPRHLSGGGMQRLAIARAMIPDPEVIFADEIVSMVDTSFRAAIVELLHELNEKMNVTMIMISHDIGVARYFSHDGGRIAVLCRGAMIEIAPAEKVLGNPMHPYTRALILASPVTDPELSRKKAKFLLKYNKPEEVWETEIAAIKGCKYAPLCPFATERCWKEKPRLEKVDGDHFVACHRAKDLPEWELRGA
ncbi:ABC transporter ATP-binding protein [Thermococcus sp. MV5]|uniref:ABC transporter ATP-binding protein n=1 Tax=Thermococcus sp. MV5 TaxID=1638272 RepID=UPI001439BF2B|nr:ABC transporter ATP-binding protein [Thermococcus sp. MV5]NJE26140.1 ABC transporter ATP-binding protein [Thermococcus sp. MV5]